MLFINGRRADDLAGNGYFTKQRWAIPFGLGVAWLAVKHGGKLTARLVSAVVRHPLVSAAGLFLTVAYIRYGRWGALGVLAGIMLMLSSWLYASPTSFDRRVVQPARGWWRWHTRYRLAWYPALHGCGLTRTTPDRQVYVPKVLRVTSTRWVDTLHVKLLHGHTPEDLSQEGEGLRHAFGALRCTVVEDRPGRVRIIFFARDPLKQPIPATALDDVPAVPDLTALPVGRTEHGSVCTLRLKDTHLVISAATGAGKSKFVWGVILSLAPGIHAGLVRVTGLDPKGGQELYPGRALFSHYEDESPLAIAAEIDRAVDRMVARKKRLRGQSQDWSMSTTEPFELVIIDELAALTSYTGDRKFKERVAAQIQLLLSQGRSVGFSVISCLQDPRKEVLPFRDLYPTRIALRVTEDSHCNLTLGDGAKERGALCHLIPESMPGVGFMRLEGAVEPVRVRFGHITEQIIAAMVDRWPAPPLPEPGAEVIDLTAHERQPVPDHRSEFGTEPEGSAGA